MRFVLTTQRILWSQRWQACPDYVTREMEGPAGRMHSTPQTDLRQPF